MDRAPSAVALPNLSRSDVSTLRAAPAPATAALSTPAPNLALLWLATGGPASTSTAKGDPGSASFDLASLMLSSYEPAPDAHLIRFDLQPWHILPGKTCPLCKPNFFLNRWQSRVSCMPACTRCHPNNLDLLGQKEARVGCAVARMPCMSSGRATGSGGFTRGGS